MAYEQHLHQLARRHHATMQQLDTLQAKVSGVTSRVATTAEFGAGALIGGLIDGKAPSGNMRMSFGVVPSNLLLAGVFLAGGHWDVSRGARWGEHAINLGNGVLASFLASMGYEFGERWKATGKFLGSGTP